MIIKSMARKEASFAQLVGYMERDGAERLLFHNLFGHSRTPAEEVVREFESNAGWLRRRKNGNALYHEIISLSSGHALGKDEARRILADVGHEYLARRAPGQIAYGTLHRDSGHLHLHLCVSANEIGRSDRVRLSKGRFAEIQKELERIVMERYPELRQEPVYAKGRARVEGRVKTTKREQQFKNRTGTASRKEDVARAAAEAFDLAETREGLRAALAERGLSLYVRGSTAGVTDADGTRHRLKTLGVGLHFSAALERIAARDAPEIPGGTPADGKPLSKKEARLAELDKAAGRAGGRSRLPGLDR